jgi:outer membrane protein OmpA-like peptidoglycan-associated protein
MKALLLALGTALLITHTATAQTAAPPAADGSAMQSGDIAKQWQKAPAPTGLPPGVRTRGFAKPQPQIHTRGAGLSQAAVDANSAAIDNLRNRGVKVLKGADAIAAQTRQDQSPSITQPPQESAPGLTAVMIPIAPEKQIAFRLHFKKDSTDLADEASQQQVSKIAQAMKELPDAVFLLEGHTCDLGEPGYNQHLSEARALQVRTLLGTFGIAANRLLSVGQGETQCEVPNTSEFNRSLNRRVVIGPIELPHVP